MARSILGRVGKVRLAFVVTRLALEGVGWVEAGLVGVVVDGHEAGVREQHVVGPRCGSAVPSLLVPKSNRLIVRVGGVHGVGEVVDSRPVFLRVLRPEALWGGADGGEYGAQEEEDLENDAFIDL